MDFARPIEVVIPGAQGKLLAALARVSGPLTLRAAAEVAGISTGQCSQLLSQLVRLGIVEREDVPPAAHFRLVREHVAAKPLLELLEADDRFVQALGRLAARIRPAPVSIVTFGSLVRGDARSDSDIDVLIVRPARFGEDDARWRDSIASWIAGAERASGNAVNLVEVDEVEARRLLKSGRGVWSSIRREGIGVFGLTVDELRGGRRGTS